MVQLPSALFVVLATESVRWIELQPIEDIRGDPYFPLVAGHLFYVSNEEFYRQKFCCFTREVRDASSNSEKNNV